MSQSVLKPTESQLHAPDKSSPSIRWNIRPFIDGRYRSSDSKQQFTKVNPATETTLYEVPIGEWIDVDKAVGVARQRFEDGCWSKMAPIRRAEILLKLADLLTQNKAELAIMDTLEMGKPIQAALFEVENLAPAFLRSWAGFADKLTGVAAPLGPDSLSFNVYEPRGVIGAISPWNFPTLNAIYKIGPALSAGNTMVLKPSELSPSSALRIAELALEAGVPDGVLNVVPGVGATAGAALAQHPDVDMISFTGSTAIGRKIMEMSGRSNGKPLLLECGGKSPQVVFDDVEDLNMVAQTVVDEVLWNQGQVCSARTRLIVHDSIKESLVERIVTRASKYSPGDPLDETTIFGPLASPAQRDRVKAYVDDALSEGAHAVLKGDIQETGGCYVSPTVFDRVDPSASIVQEEIFGPVLCVQNFSTEDEAIRLANGTDFGLGATVWTRDIGRGKRLTHAIRAGSVVVRTSGNEGTEPASRLSFEPQKASGFGSELGLKGLESYSNLKSVSFKGA